MSDDSLKRQLAEANAACATMRKALEELVYDTNSDDNYCEATCDCIGREEECEYSESHCRTKWRNLVIRYALSSDAGKDLLEQLNKANDIIRNLVDNSLEFGGQCYECRPSTHFTCDQCYMGEAHEYVRTCLKRGENDA